MIKLNKKKSKHSNILKNIFLIFSAMSGFLFAFLFGAQSAYHFSMIFSPNCVASIEVSMFVADILLVLLGIFGSYLSLGLIFEGTKLEKLFPIFGNDKSN